MGRSVSAETVRNVIRHAGYSSRVARKKPFISLQNQKKRLEFTKTHQLNTDNFWKEVIFSDESKFNIFGSDGRRTVRRKPNTVLDPKNLRLTVKHGGGSVIVWGCMASNGVGNLVFIDGIMDHKLYIDIHNNNLKGSAKKLGLDGNFIFQQDNDSKHTAHNLVALHFKYDQARRTFVEWAQNEIAVVPDFHKRILFSDEAHFWLNGYVNKQNCRIWSEANPQVYVETPLHPEKLTVWCALWAGGILLQKR
ncbi:transposable element Tcb1 transposase [Trichonephila clavipes]|nr:transposable element Tcb1 transposase [Trichonephila clavipes]